MAETLLIATSPRSTWITSPDIETAEHVRALLGAAAHQVRRRGAVDPSAVDVGIGVEALDAGEILMGAGYRFNWHPDQHPLDRTGTAWGIPVEEPV